MDKKIILGIVIALIVVLIGGILVISDESSKQDSGVTVATADAKVEINESKYDWGEIGINDGNVEKVFDIKNNGTKPLALFSVYTSCMCTTAQLILDDQSSPLFGMHDASSYVMEVPPGKSAKLKVVFDPAFHGPEGTGPITREIIMKTNDISSSEIKFMLIANVVK
jgi:hypothetical protein